LPFAQPRRRRRRSHNSPSHSSLSKKSRPKNRDTKTKQQPERKDVIYDGKNIKRAATFSMRTYYYAIDNNHKQNSSRTKEFQDQTIQHTKFYITIYFRSERKDPDSRHQNKRPNSYYFCLQREHHNTGIITAIYKTHD
jgi:hypothetical protein